MWLQEAKHQRLMKVKLKDVQFRTDKYNAQRKWEEKLHFTNATVTKATKYSNSELRYSFARQLQKQICIPESC